MLKVAVHANHRSIEHYLYSLLPDVLFLRSGADGEMHLRELPPNCINLGGRQKVIDNEPDMAIARNASAVEWYRENGLPTLWFLSGPPQVGQRERRRAALAQCQASVAYSAEHAEFWSDPEWPRCHVCHYPIDTEVFEGYNGDIQKALMIATMHMSWWRGTGWKGTDFFKKCLDAGMPYQLIGFNNREKDGDMWDAADPYPINDEATMVDCLTSHRVYGHTGSFLCRSPLEAMAVGAPVVIRHSRVGHYLAILPHDEGVFRAVTNDEFVEAVTFFLNNPLRAKEFGARGRARIASYFNPRFVQTQWEEAIEACLST